MVNIIRRFQQPLMVIITVLVIVSFIWLFSNKSTMDRSISTSVGMMYGRPVSFNQLQRTANLFQLARELGERDLIDGLLGRQVEFAMMIGQISTSDVMREFAFADMILRHEAEKLGIEPTQTEIEDVIQKLPAFVTNGAFDSSKFNEFISTQLGPLGFSDAQIAEVVGDGLRVRKLQELVAGATQPSLAEVRRLYEQRYQKSEASLVRFKLEDFKTAIQISNEDLKKLFEEKKETLKTPEKRKVKVAAFTVAETLKGPKRAEALQKLESAAADFAVALGEKNSNFDELAGKAKAKVTDNPDCQVKVADAPEFTAAEPPTELGKSAEVAAKAFELTKSAPNSDPVAGQDGYYVLQLSEIVEGRPRTFEETKAELTEQLKEERSKEAMNLKAADVRSKIEAELTAGKSFADAAQAAGVKAEAFPPFSTLDRSKRTEPDANQIISAASDLKEGALGSFVPTDTGGLLVHLDKRDPVDEADFEKQKAALSSSLQESQRDELFQRWLDERRKAAKVQAGRS